ncbi:MAG TPA: hypothetical protein VF215_09315 [Thermoanaerobaculia bacterium]
MKGCARSCLLWLGGWIIGAAAFYVYLQRFGVIVPGLWWAAAGAGLCTLASIAYLLAIGTSVKERAMLLGAIVGNRPKDGAWVAISGTIRSNEPLQTPITGATAVAYEYQISRDETSSTSNTRKSKAIHYEGKALAPSTITTRQGAFRLLAVPTLDVPREHPQTPDAFARAAKYVKTTAFQTSNTPKDERIGMEQEAADDDGFFRVDKHLSDGNVDVTTCRLEERHIKQGEMVCAFGLYSVARGGLIPHPNWSRTARLMRGDATTVSDQLGNRIIKYAIGAVIFAAAAFGITKLYESKASVHREVHRQVQVALDRGAVE